MSEQKFEALNDELLEATEVDEQLEIPKKSNNKQGLIDKIMQVSEKHNIPLEHSQTKLKGLISAIPLHKPPLLSATP